MITRPTSEEIASWLRETDEERLSELFEHADAIRRERVGDTVHLRGLIEISNRCSRDCHYCGIRRSNTSVQRYLMSVSEIVECAVTAEKEFGYGTVVLQAGEGPGVDSERVTRIVEGIAEKTSLAIALSLGERKRSELLRWKNAGADRYLLRIETTNAELFRRIHPADTPHARDRMAVLADLRELGYEVGSGVLIGLPGQTYDDLANDLDTFARIDLDMIGCGPFIPSPGSPLADASEREKLRIAMGCREADQVPATNLMTYKVVALARLVCPDSNIPTTTAVATLGGKEGRETGLQRGGNVLMPNLTPEEYRRLYVIYPNKASSLDSPEATHRGVVEMLEAMGRPAGFSRGDSRKFLAREGA